MATSKNKKITYVGLIGMGIMGSAMALNLTKSGFSVVGVDTDLATKKKMRKNISHVVDTPAEILSYTNHLITSLPSTAALSQVCYALIDAKRVNPSLKNIIIAETSTLPLEDKEVAQKKLADAGITLLDCPLSGTGAQAKTGDLAIYASGGKANIVKMQAIFKGFSRAQHFVGEFGAGTKMKLVANLLVALHNVTTAEALLFGEGMGLDANTMVNVLSDGAGGSRMLEVRGPVMAKRQWAQAAMKVEIWQKDMSIIQAALTKAKVPAPLFAASIPIYVAAMAQGHALDDTAAVYAVLERMASRG